MVNGVDLVGVRMGGEVIGFTGGHNGLLSIGVGGGAQVASIP